MKTIGELPAKLDDIIHFSCNIDSLVQIIQFLHKNNTDMGMDIKDLTRRVKSFEHLNDKIDQVTLKTEAHEKKINEAEESLYNHAGKLLEIESKISEATKVNDKAIEAHEENINNLNRVVEDHLKSAKSQDEKISNLQQNLIETTLKVDKNMAESKNIKQMETQMKESISNVSIQMNELKDNYELKVLDIDKTVSNLISAINRGGAQEGEVSNASGGLNPVIPKRSSTQTNVSGTSVSDYLVKLALDDIDKLSKSAEETTRNFAEIFKMIKKSNERNEEQKNETNKRIDHLKEIMANNQLSYSEQRMNSNENNHDEDNQTTKDINNFVNKPSLKCEESQKELLELYQQLSENISIIGTSLGDKINRDELKNFNQITLGKIEILSDKLTESLLMIEKKMKKISSLGADGSSNQMLDFDFFTQSLEKQMIDNINKISLENIQKLVLDADISSNPTLNRLIIHINKHTDQLNEAYKSIVDIRSVLVSNEVLEEIGDIKTRLELSEEDLRRLKYKFDEFKNSLEEEEQPEPIKQSNYQQLPKQSTISMTSNVKSSITFLTSALNNLNDKVLNIEKKSKEMTTEIRESIKNSLKSETERVIEQFQKNLNSFTNKFEYQLKNKIDQINLSSFEYKMNHRFTHEMKNKLDQKDMKKNNNVINRKLDSLENKISKTLVDTIIDLQMDEAPLIVTKNNKNVEKCASCNQSLPQTTYLLTSNDNVASSGIVNKMRTSKINFKDKDKEKDKDKDNKDKLPEID